MDYYYLLGPLGKFSQNSNWPKKTNNKLFSSKRQIFRVTFSDRNENVFIFRKYRHRVFL